MLFVEGAGETLGGPRRLGRASLDYTEGNRQGYDQLMAVRVEAKRKIRPPPLEGRQGRVPTTQLDLNDRHSSCRLFNQQKRTVSDGERQAADEAET